MPDNSGGVKHNKRKKEREGEKEKNIK